MIYPHEIHLAQSEFYFTDELFCEIRIYLRSPSFIPSEYA